MSERVTQEVKIEEESRDPIDVIAGIKASDASDERPKSSFEVVWGLTHSA